MQILNKYLSPKGHGLTLMKDDTFNLSAVPSECLYHKPWSLWVIADAKNNCNISRFIICFLKPHKNKFLYSIQYFIR
jgi:hypothetical protein